MVDRSMMIRRLRGKDCYAHIINFYSQCFSCTIFEKKIHRINFCSKLFLIKFGSIFSFADFEETQLKQQQQQQVQQMGKGNNGNWHEKFAQWNLNN